MQNTNSPAVVQAAQEKGAMAFGWNSDMSKFGGKAHLAASGRIAELHPARQYCAHG